MENKPELKPLSAEEAELFGRHRHSAAVVQNKCTRCGAWYETRRGERLFVESFVCDCGTPLAFDVPPLEVTGEIIRQATNADMFLIGDGDQRLDSGMKVSEAISRARQWWDGKGARLARLELSRQSLPVGSSDNGAGGAFASLDPDDPSFLPSGLIHGKPWDALSKRERLMLVKVWHHFFIRMPDVLGDGDKPHKIQDRRSIQ